MISSITRRLMLFLVGTTCYKWSKRPIASIYSDVLSNNIYSKYILSPFLENSLWSTKGFHEHTAFRSDPGNVWFQNFWFHTGHIIFKYMWLADPLC